MNTFSSIVNSNLPNLVECTNVSLEVCNLLKSKGIISGSVYEDLYSFHVRKALVNSKNYSLLLFNI